MCRAYRIQSTYWVALCEQPRLSEKYATTSEFFPEANKRNAIKIWIITFVEISRAFAVVQNHSVDTEGLFHSRGPSVQKCCDYKVAKEMDTIEIKEGASVKVVV